MTLSRRQSLATLGALLTTPAWASTLVPNAAYAQTPALRLGPARRFDWAWLIEYAQALAAQPYQEPPRPAPELVEQIDYDAHGKLRLKPEYALWGREGSVYPITFVHLGRYFPKSIRMHKVEDGQAQEVLYETDYFTVPEGHPAAGLPSGASAFAGFWVQESRRSGDWRQREPWVTFVGASYFRSVGALGQVGLSARGIALNVGDPGPEEFPDFTQFWFTPTQREGDPQVVYALLEGPSLTGAYRFVMSRQRGVVMEVEKRLFIRRDIARLGIAPLTSMFWYGEYGDQRLMDWRPEVHDSDGLALWTGAGERIWRPLNNPDRPITSSFQDRNPLGFGLSQRDRNYDHYLDGVNYHHRPSCWVEPLGSWGSGAVQLIELPTDDEIHDNIVAYWLPSETARAGSSLTYRYRLHWEEFEPFYPAVELARCVATRTGRGGEAGKPRPPGVVKFAVEFDGASLADIPWGARPEVVATASRGEISLRRSDPVWYTPRWLASFDLTVDGPEPVELRCHMELDGKVLTESWLYQYHPPR
ncbi:glucan biosynthesis protein [Pelagibius sp.]|uniref:glucan biosynthesis protein n=1 Tax=Pelagibius sp. TaxID=1931238 RepID=UPI003BAE7ABE